MNKIFLTLAWSGIITFLGLTILFGFWWLYPYKVMQFNTSPFVVQNQNKTVKRGDRLIYEVDACKYMNIVPELTKFFIDGVIYETPKSIGAVEMGCHTQLIDVYVPKAIPVGVYRMKFVARYKVNPLRYVEYVNYSEQFTVINP